MPTPADTKVCPTCGRSFGWRKKWEKNWEHVTYCSDQCRRSKPGELDARIERMVMELVRERGRGSSICPSEAARAIEPEGFKALMPRVHNAARRLARAGAIVITQKGRPVDPDAARGPTRLSLR